MADDFKTLREVSLGIGGIRREIRMYAGGFLVLAAIAGGLFKVSYDKLDALEASNARIEGMLSTVVSDAKQIKENTTLASAEPPKPTVDSFKGYVGVHADQAPRDTLPALMEGDLKDAWIYLPAQ